MTLNWKFRRLINPDAGLIALLAFVVVLCVYPRLRGPIDLRWDASVYYVLGTALAEGKGYRLLNEPGQIQGTQYPPLLPACIAVVQALTASDDPLTVGRWLRFEYLVLFCAYVFAAYAVSRRYVPAPAAFMVGIFCVINAYTHSSPTKRLPIYLLHSP